MPIVEVNHVSKQYRLGERAGIMSAVTRAAARLVGRPVSDEPPFNALTDVHFSAQEGEVLGIIGENGAGKSTLLKLLAGITQPTTGSVKVHGAVAPLIEVGAGLIGEMTGRENIYLNGAILGMRRAEIKRQFDDIVAFAELEDFIDTPLKRYSSGMTIRLAFSIAVSAQSDVLIVDEVLAVGDLAFQAKCYDRMEYLIKKQRKTVLLVSHDVRQVERLCSRVLLIDHGRVVMDAPAAETCNVFYERMDERIRFNVEKALARNIVTSDEVELAGIEVLDETGRKTATVIYGGEVTVVLRFRVNADIEHATVRLGLHTPDYVKLATDVSPAHRLRAGPDLYVVRCKIAPFPFLPGTYGLSVGVTDESSSRSVFTADGASTFRVTTRDRTRKPVMHHGVVSWESTWRAARVDSRPNS